MVYDVYIIEYYVKAIGIVSVILYIKTLLEYNFAKISTV